MLTPIGLEPFMGTTFVGICPRRAGRILNEGIRSGVHHRCWVRLLLPPLAPVPSQNPRSNLSQPRSTIHSCLPVPEQVASCSNGSLPLCLWWQLWNGSCWHVADAAVWPVMTAELCSTDLTSPMGLAWKSV